MSSSHRTSRFRVLGLFFYDRDSIRSRKIDFPWIYSQKNNLRKYWFQHKISQYETISFDPNYHFSLRFNLTTLAEICYYVPSDESCILQRDSQLYWVVNSNPEDLKKFYLLQFNKIQLPTIKSKRLNIIFSHIKFTLLFTSFKKTQICENFCIEPLIKKHLKIHLKNFLKVNKYIF